MEAAHNLQPGLSEMSATGTELMPSSGKTLDDSPETRARITSAMSAISTKLAPLLLSGGLLLSGCGIEPPKDSHTSGFGPAAQAQAEKQDRERASVPGYRHPEPTISDRISGAYFDTTEVVKAGGDKIVKATADVSPWVLNLGLMALIIGVIRRKDLETEGWTEAGIMLVLGLLGIAFDLPMTPMVLAALAEGGVTVIGGGRVPWWIKLPMVFGTAAGALKYIK
ncbi:MAG: hypothetical protein WC843_06290 [Candidatus Gracilibacteria bacterium]